MDRNEGVLKYLNDFPGGVCLVSRDEEERILAVNREALRIFECASEQQFMEFTKGLFRNLMADEDAHSLAGLYQGSERRGNYNFYEGSSKTRTGHFIRVEGVFGPAVDGKRGALWVVGLAQSDVRQSALEKDSDTGLLGPHAFYRKAKQLLKEEEASGIWGQRVPVFINLVHFSSFNSSYGIEAGNTLIYRIAQVLRACFPHAPATHLGADNFMVLSSRDHITMRMDRMVKEINDLIQDRAIRCKAGLVLFDKDHVPPEKLKTMNWRDPFDMAKLAADSIKEDGNRSWAVYTESLGRDMVNTAFVLRNFENAMEKGHIHVYYQPITRALTGKVCGLEALARWEDPEKGMILPGLFVPVLEKMKLIHLLDRYVIESTARLYHQLKEAGHPILPVSVNLSRVDFDIMKPFDFMEEIIFRYQVPRQFFHIEVTESALTRDRGVLKKELLRFKKAGYRLWLDDFGSGYSSLNVLQEFPFDLLKIDMAFLRNFNEESRKIIRSIILMAKNLSVHTLAEGAETKEQVDFLRESGCEEIQGYFYGKPMTSEDFEKKLMEGTYVPEGPLESVVMNRVGLVNVLTDKPVGLFLNRKDRFVLLLKNDALQQVGKDVYGGGNIYFEGNEVPHSHPIYPWIQALIEGSRASGQEQSVVAMRNGFMLKNTMHTLAGNESLCGGTVSILNMSVKDEHGPVQTLDMLYRNMMRIFDALYYYQGDKQTVDVILSSIPGMRPGSALTPAQWHHLADYVHPDDREQFLHFIQPENIQKTAAASIHRLSASHFRIKDSHGRYRWKEVIAMVMGKAEENHILLGAKDTVLTPLPEAERAEFLHLYAASLLGTGKEETKEERDRNFARALRRKSEFKFFWKDRNRRFLGASDAFLHYYGFSDEKAILGKTDEDMGWHLGDSTYKVEEEKVLQKGLVSYNARGKCIARGKLHSIRATKVPVYEGNEIIGLLGWFVDLNDETAMKEKDSLRSFTNEESGVLSYRGIVIEAEHYADAFQSTGMKYEGILLDIPAIEDFGKAYGKDSRRELVRRIVKEIRASFGGRAIIGRMSVNRFLILHNMEDKGITEKELDTLSRKIHEIHSVDGCPCTLFLRSARVDCTETEDIDEMKTLLLRRAAYHGQ
ncbi:GGDEF domain-containing phosphodiesterase [uncultured Dialister sp.]|jgi:EAL domain-containing protein (putative c-di-GMP-specific phosphodiesterase class I)/GGDEF domain-containing protein|uniref:GGDEF domain-containing phosphodiesterase n=1 Tax=uncultured Dialister sp. TaxID=278064 RepID=UPI00260E78DE|nr:GGDEF domain-containing phosphodiesterase [uncultured Dialister sp.]